MMTIVENLGYLGADPRTLSTAVVCNLDLKMIEVLGSISSIGLCVELRHYEKNYFFLIKSYN